MTATDGGASAPSLPDRRRILDAALGPEPVEAAADAELRPGPHVAIEHFAVIADLLDDAHDPVLGQAELLAVGALGPQHPLDLRLRRLHGFIDGLRRYAQLLGIEHGELHPFHDGEPLVVAAAHRRRERLLGYDLGQDHVIAGIAELELLGIELRYIG